MTKCEVECFPGEGESCNESEASLSDRYHRGYVIGVACNSIRGIFKTVIN